MNESQLKLEQAKMKEQYLESVKCCRTLYIWIFRMCIKTIWIVGCWMPPMRSAIERRFEEKLSKIGRGQSSAIEEYQEFSTLWVLNLKQQGIWSKPKIQLRRVISRINRIYSRRFKKRTWILWMIVFTRVFPIFEWRWSEVGIACGIRKTKEMGVKLCSSSERKCKCDFDVGEKSSDSGGSGVLFFLVETFSLIVCWMRWDAPLDDANVFRFNDLVREMSKRSQIILWLIIRQ